MNAEEIERCPKCGAYCFPAKHSSDTCAQIEILHAQNRIIEAGPRESNDAAVEARLRNSTVNLEGARVARAYRCTD